MEREESVNEEAMSSVGQAVSTQTHFFWLAGAKYSACHNLK